MGSAYYSKLPPGVVNCHALSLFTSIIITTAHARSHARSQSCLPPNAWHSTNYLSWYICIPPSSASIHCNISFHTHRCLCDNVLDSLLTESKILPQVCWLPGGGSSKDLHTLSRGRREVMVTVIIVLIFLCGRWFPFLLYNFFMIIIIYSLYIRS